jgi:pyruvate kinase
MELPSHKTKIVCTIGPACRTPSKLEEMIQSGMNVARLNFSHGDFREHAGNIRNIRAGATKSGRPVGILIDLPGIKIRVGRLPNSFFSGTKRIWLF